MPVRVEKIIEKLRGLAPEQLAESWDNVGLQIGSINNNASKILLALDATSRVIDEAIGKGVDMIITHHPLLFNPLKTITKDSPEGRDIYKLIQNNINLYSMHTNLDSAFGGTNDVLAEKIGLFDIQSLVPTKNSISEEQEVQGIYGLGRIGNIKTTTIKNLSCKLKKLLQIESVRVVGDLDREINKVALCTGSGMSLFKNVIGKADIYITGDIKFHEAQEARAYGIGLIDVGHYASENIVMPAVRDYLNEFAQEHNIEIIISNLNEEPFINI